MSYSIVQQLADLNLGFWSGEKVEQILETAKVEAWLNFDKNKAVLTRVHSLNDNSRPASVISDILFGSFLIDEGVFKGGVVTKAAQVKAEPAMAYRDQSWKLFDINLPFSIDQSIDPFNANNSFSKSNEFYRLVQRKENPEFSPGYEDDWYAIYIDRRVSDTASFPDNYKNWDDAKAKLRAWGFEDPFLDQFYGYTDGFNEIDIYKTIQHSSDGENEDTLSSNEGPTALFLSISEFSENIPSGSAISTLSTSDQDAGDTHIYALVSGDGDADNSAFIIEGDQLKIIQSPDFETKSSYSIRLETKDADGLSLEREVTLNVSDVNEEPLDISVSASSFNENIASGSAVATLSTSDPDSGDTHTYSLVSGDGDIDSNAFTIEGNQLKIVDSPDYETQDSYSIRIQAEDLGGLTVEKSFSLDVNNLDNSGVSDATAPALISYELSSYNFDLSKGDVTIDITAQITDDLSGVFDGQYANGSGGSPSQAGWRSPSGNQYLSGGVFSSPSSGTFLDGVFRDQTVLSAYSETGTWTLDNFLVVDEAGNTKSLNKDEIEELGIQTTFEVTAGASDTTAPTNLSVSTSNFDENIAGGSAVATLSTSDPDSGDTHTYALVSGAGDSDNSAFTIEGDQLKIVDSPDFESKSSYSIRLETKDSGGLTFEKVFALTVNDLPESATQNIDLWVSAGSFEAPYYRFYTDAEGSQELTEQVLDSSKSYTFRRLNEATSHPFYISDSGFKQSSSDALLITGDGSPLQGITGDESFKIQFTDLAATTEELLYYCSSHSSMQRTLDLIDGSGAVLQVSNVRQIASGLALKLSAAPDLEKLNLYDGTDASIDLPDLQLTRSNGTVVDDLSLHWKEESSELFLIQTDSLTGISKKQFDAGASPFQSDRLVEGNYELVIDARSDGLISVSSGELIDGNGDGITGDPFTYSFTKKTPINVISIGDTVRGSGQSLGLNGIAHSNGINGLPVLVSTTAEIRSISGNVSYDATAFDNASLVVGHDLPDDWVFETQEYVVGSLNYTAWGTTAITGTDQELFRFEAVVSEDAVYGSSTLIEATIETPEDPSPSFESDPSLVVLAYSGDTTGNGSHSSLDASRVQRVVVGLDSGFDALDDINPVLIGDTTGNGSLSSLDASRIQQEVVGLPVDTFPEIPII